MTIRIETEQEIDGLCITDAPDLSGVMVYGQTKEQAIRLAEALALRVIAERLEFGEPVPEVTEQLFDVAA